MHGAFFRVNKSISSNTRNQDVYFLNPLSHLLYSDFGCTEIISLMSAPNITPFNCVLLVRFRGDIQRKTPKNVCFLGFWFDLFLSMRRERDSNPRYSYPYVSLANWWFQPLTHPSCSIEPPIGSGGKISNILHTSKRIVGKNYKK